MSAGTQLGQQPIKRFDGSAAAKLVITIIIAIASSIATVSYTSGATANATIQNAKQIDQQQAQIEELRRTKASTHDLDLVRGDISAVRDDIRDMRKDVIEAIKRR